MALFAVMYVDRSRGELTPPPYPMRFDLTIHEWWANLGCVTPDGKRNDDASMTTEITWTIQGEPFGNFAVCSLDVDSSWFGKYTAEQEAKGGLKGVLNVAPTIAALKPRCQLIARKINQYLDDCDVPGAPTDIERSVATLLGLVFDPEHHPRFEDVRRAYIGALSDVGPDASHHWLGRFLLPTMLDGENHDIDFDTLGAMRQCMIQHDASTECHMLHYAYQLGVLATYLAHG